MTPAEAKIEARRTNQAVTLPDGRTVWPDGIVTIDKPLPDWARRLGDG